MTVERSNQEWLQDLSASGERQSAAIEALRGVLLRAALYTCQRNLAGQAQFSQLEIEQIAEDCAQEALISVLERLDSFRGESKFLTWTYKFAVNIALGALRREQWKGVSLDDLDELPTGSPIQAEEDAARPGPELALLRGETWEILHRVIQEELTEKQRLVLKWMVFDEVPMDVVVQRLGTNRNAIYKLLHDSRSKLKKALLARGVGVHEAIDLYRPEG